MEVEVTIDMAESLEPVLDVVLYLISTSAFGAVAIKQYGLCFYVFFF